MQLRRAVLAGLVGLAAVFVPLPHALSQPPAVAGHPAEDYRRAAELFQAGRREEATYWFYRGQFRYRVHLKARPDLTSDSALFASLGEAIGRPINEWAFGDVPALAATLDRVLAWQAENDDAFTPKAEFAAAHAEVRAGLQALRNRIVVERASIAAQRRANGLPNRN